MNTNLFTWNQEHLKYKDADWINTPSVFSGIAIKYFPSEGRLLDVGCGQGVDSRLFNQNGYKVDAFDFSDEGIKIAKEKSQNLNINFFEFNILDKLPFDNETFDIVYSHLSLHYFDKIETQKIFLEIYRVLKKGGILAIFVNSLKLKENPGVKIEDDYYKSVDGLTRRYFTTSTLQDFTKNFETLLLNDRGQTHSTRPSSSVGMIQYIGRKK